eukprot:563601-Rhodomonas_salina.3
MCGTDRGCAASCRRPQSSEATGQSPSGLSPTAGLWHVRYLPRTDRAYAATAGPYSASFVAGHHTSPFPSIAAIARFRFLSEQEARGTRAF